MDLDELRLQRRGYVAAFRSPELIHQIKSLPLGRIAVAYFEWGAGHAGYYCPWTLVKDEAGAEEVAAEGGGAARPRVWHIDRRRSDVCRCAVPGQRICRSVEDDRYFRRRTKHCGNSGRTSQGRCAGPWCDDQRPADHAQARLVKWPLQHCRTGFLLRGLRDRRAGRLHSGGEERRPLCRCDQTQAVLEMFSVTQQSCYDTASLNGRGGRSSLIVRSSSPAIWLLDKA
jgi:hypothetical protein